MPTPEHERPATLFDKLLTLLTLAFDLEIYSLGSTTFTSAWAAKGLEPDQCYYLKRIDKVMGKKSFYQLALGKIGSYTGNKIADQIFEAGLIKWHAALCEERDPRGVPVHADDIVPEIGEARRGHPGGQAGPQAQDTPCGRRLRSARARG